MYSTNTQIWQNAAECRAHQSHLQIFMHAELPPSNNVGDFKFMGKFSRMHNFHPAKK